MTSVSSQADTTISSGLKPHFLGLDSALQFSEQGTVDAYVHRPPYTDEAISIIEACLPEGYERVLDVGCGRGDLTIKLAQRIPVTGVDISEPMIEAGKSRIGGDSSNLDWRVGSIENQKFEQKFGAITAAESLHWLPWKTVFPVFNEILVDGGQLIKVSRDTHDTPWWNEVAAVIDSYHTVEGYGAYDTMQLLTDADFIVPGKVVRTGKIPVVQSIPDYIEQLHSRNGCTRERLGPDLLDEFDRKVKQILEQYVEPDGNLHFSTSTRLHFAELVR